MVRFCKIPWDLASYGEICWDLVHLWDSVRFNEIWWDMVRFCEIWWDLAGFDEILWDLVRFNENLRIWQPLAKNCRKYCVNTDGCGRTDGRTATHIWATGNHTKSRCPPSPQGPGGHNFIQFYPILWAWINGLFNAVARRQGVNKWQFKEKCQICWKFLFPFVRTQSIVPPDIFPLQYTVRALKSWIPQTTCWCITYYECIMY